MYDIDNINIGQMLREYRKINRLTLSDIGVCLNKTKATISKYEKNEIIPDCITLLKMCNILCINLSDLFPVNEHLNVFPYSNKLYLYYLNGKKIVSSNIEIFVDNYKYKLKLYSKYNNKFEYYSEGILEYSNSLINIHLNSSINKKYRS